MTASRSRRFINPTATIILALTVVITACGTAANTSSIPSDVEDTGNGEGREAGIAESYLSAVTKRDIQTARVLLADSVTLDWGPASSVGELEQGWAWEDSFAMAHTLDRCERVGTDSEETATTRCWLLVESEIAAAVGNEPGHVCVDIETSDGVITSVQGLDFSTGCELNYWTYAFVPFSNWLAKAHPGTTVEEMYEDRMSVEGLALWTDYTKQFLIEMRASE